MASYLACCPAADRVVAEDNAVFMIHNAWTWAVGNAADLIKTAETLTGLDALMNQAYVKRTGKSADEIASMMSAETWLYGSEIRDAGFVDEIIGSEDGEKDRAAALSTGKVKFLCHGGPSEGRQ
jgi:ATP-dependent Clp protease protease subunit